MTRAPASVERPSQAHRKGRVARRYGGSGVNVHALKSQSHAIES